MGVPEVPPGPDIRGILLDSGDTLVRPIEGRWWPGSRFYDILAARGIQDLQWNRMNRALQEAMRYLERHHHLATEDEERGQFQAYYTILLGTLGLPSPPKRVTYELARALVDGIDIVPFSDTRRVLRKLRDRGYSLGLVSNAWPSLERKYRSLGLLEFFDAVMISARIGAFKPDRRIYQQAIDALGLPPQALLFVDDEPHYVEAAIALGMNGVVMVRTGPSPPGGLRWVRNLDEVERLLT